MRTKYIKGLIEIAKERGVTREKMEIGQYDREYPLTKEEMEDIGLRLLESLSRFLGLRLITFMEHYVQEGSIVLTFRSNEPVHNILNIQMEGVLLFDVRGAGLPPSVDAEIFLFSCRERLGLQKHEGRSYLSVGYDARNDTWKIADWICDADEEWEYISATREDEYDQVVKTYDFEES